MITETSITNNYIRLLENAKEIEIEMINSTISQNYLEFENHRLYTELETVNSFIRILQFQIR